MDILQLKPEGLYCPAGDFHIDPVRPVARAVITHGHGDHARPGSATYWTAAVGVPILRKRLGALPAIRGLAYGDTLTMGRAHVSLSPAGHILGSAQVRVEVDGEVWVVTGDFKRDPDPTCAPFQVTACDTLITEATFAFPVYRWRPAREVVGEIHQWRRRCGERGRSAVLFCYALGKAQRILAELLHYGDETVLLHGAMQPLVDIYRRAGIPMARTRPVSETDRRQRRGALILAPPSAAGSPWMRRFRDCETGFASGWMRIRGNRRRRGYDRGFVISDHTDWPGLLSTVSQSGARRVLVTHGQSEVLARYLRERGLETGVLGAQGGEVS